MLTYDSKTWAMTIIQMGAPAVRVAQGKLEPMVLGILLRDRKHEAWIRQQTGCHRCHQKVKISMGRTRRQTTGQQVDYRINGLVTSRMDKIARETKSEMKGRACSQFVTRMAKTGPRQMPVEAIQGRVLP